MLNAKTKFLVRSAALMVLAAGLAAIYVLLAPSTTSRVTPSLLPDTPLIAPPSSTATTERTNAGPPVFPDKLPIYQPSFAATAFQHVGILTSKTEGANNNQPVILPLFGRPSPIRRERWEYYAATDKNAMMRIPVVYENRDCTNDDVGCNEIREGELVRVPTYENFTFGAQMYKLGTALRQ